MPTSRNSLKTKIQSFRRDLFSRLGAAWMFLPTRAGIIIIALVLMAGGLTLFLRSNLFLVSEIEVSPTLYVTSDELKEVSAKYIGERVFTTPVSDVQSAFETSSVYVKSAQVDKILPSKIKITIVERLPYVRLFDSTYKRLYYLDSDKVVLEEGNQIDIKNLYQVAQVDLVDTLQPGDLERGEVARVKNLDFLISIKDLISAKYKKEITEKSYRLDAHSVQVITQKDIVATFDPTQSADIQLRRLVLILQDSKKKGRQLKSVNLGFENPYGVYK